jgi:hypothetical protein
MQPQSSALLIATNPYIRADEPQAAPAEGTLLIKASTAVTDSELNLSRTSLKLFSRTRVSQHRLAPPMHTGKRAHFLQVNESCRDW